MYYDEWHWAPNIRDGYALCGRPRKPRPLIMLTMHDIDIMLFVQLLLTLLSDHTFSDVVVTARPQW